MARTGIIAFAMAASNAPFIVEDPTRWWNWLAAAICCGIGFVMVYPKIRAAVIAMHTQRKENHDGKTS